MKYQSIPNSLFTKNRKKLYKNLLPSSLVILNSNDILPSNADGTLPFRQNNDMFYLSGVDQEDSICVLFPDAHNPKFREILFLKETSPEIAIWEGSKLNMEQAREVSGIQTIYWLQDFESILKSIIYEAEHVYLNTNEHLRAKFRIETRDERFAKDLKSKYPHHSYKRLAPLLHRLRSVKEPEEIDLMQNACNITEKAFRRLLEFVKPGVMEYEIEAEILHEFVRNRSRGPAYEMIVASGYNACVLHYTENNMECKAGDVILLDIGAEYANYASDMSRSIPVSGKYTARQKEVYNSVLSVMKDVSKLLIPGAYLDDYHKAVGLRMEEELVKLGLITMHDIKNQNPEWPAYKKYFMHGTSHFIGLDVHDVGLWHEPIQAGNVFTCEPGIYIPEENLGIRIENDILIHADGQTDLMRNIPIEADEIEDLMNS